MPTYNVNITGDTKTFTVTIDGEDHNFYVADGVGPAGADGATEWNQLTGTLDVLPFTTTNGGPQNMGELAWTQADETLSLQLAHGTILQLGEETLYHVENVTGSTIANGTPVSYAGTVGNSGKMRVKPWNGATDNPLIFMGLATSDIEDDGEGYVTHFGKVRGINTQAYTANSVLYANPSGTGLTGTQPTGGQYILAAVCISSANNGTLFVRPTRFGGANWDAINGKPAFGNAALATTSTGGNGSADSGKVATFDSGGSITCQSIVITGSGFAAGFLGTLLTGNYGYYAPNANGVLTLTSSTTGIPDNLVTSSTKTTPIDADSVLMTDSEAAGTPAKRITFADFWTWIKSKIESVALVLLVKGYTESVVSIGNSGTSQTLSLVDGPFQTVTLTGNCTFTMPTATAGKSFILKVMTGAGGYTAAFTGVKWPGGTAPIITSAALKYDLVSFVSDGSAWSGSILQNYTA